MLRELRAGRTPDLLRSTQRAEYPDAPRSPRSPLKGRVGAAACLPCPPDATAHAAVAAPPRAAAAVAPAAAAPPADDASGVSLRLSAASGEAVLLEIVPAA